MNFSNELRVGIMFITGLVLLVLLIVTISRWGEARGTYTVSIRFRQVQGIQAGAEVRVAGVVVGRVTEVTFDPATRQPLVVASIKRSVPLYPDYEYTIGIGSLVGERFVEIHAPYNENPQRIAHEKPLPMTDHLEVSGSTPADFDALMGKTQLLVEQLTLVSKSINTVIGSNQNQRNLAQSLDNLNKATASAAGISASMDCLLRSNQQVFSQTMKNLNAGSLSVAEFTAQLNALLQRNQAEVDQTLVSIRKSSLNAEEFTTAMSATLQRNQQAIDLIVANMNKTTASAASISATMSALLQRNQQSVDLIAANLAATSADLRKLSQAITPQLANTNIVQNLEVASQRAVQITDRLDSIATAVNSLLNDKELAGSVRESVDHLKKASGDLERMMAETREAMEPFPEVARNLRQASEDLPKITRPFSKVAPETAENLLVISRHFREASEDISGAAHQVVKLGAVLRSTTVQSEASVLRLAQGPNAARSDFNIDIQGQKNMLRLGLTDIGEKNQLNIQAGGHVTPQSWFRYGLVQSSFGIGADYQPDHNVRLTTDIFNPAHPRANALVNYRLRQFGTDWWLSTGYYDLFSPQSLFGFGMTYRPE